MGEAKVKTNRHIFSYWMALMHILYNIHKFPM